MLFMNLEFKTPASNVMSDVLVVMKKVELIALLIACFILGKSIINKQNMKCYWEFFCST